MQHQQLAWNGSAPSSWLGSLPARAASRAAVVTASRRAAVPEMEASRLASSEASAAADTTRVGHLGDLQRRDPCCDVEGVLVHHRLETVVGCHRGQRGVVGRGDGAVHGCRGAVVRQLQAHAVGGDAAPVRSYPGQGCCRGQRCDCRRQCAAVQLRSQLCSDPVVQAFRGWMAAALLPDAACRVHGHICVGCQSEACGDVRAFRHLSVVQRRSGMLPA